MACITCGDDEISPIKATCAHDWCQDCLEYRFSLCLKDKSLFPPGCCPNHAFPDYLLIARQVLTPAQFDEFDRKAVEYTTVNPLYCPRKTCSAFIPVGPGVKCASCPACTDEVCTDCRELWHPERPCAESEEERKLLDLAHQNLWSVCPACKIICEVISGCNYVVCRCGQGFCFVCRIRMQNHNWLCQCPNWVQVKEETNNRRKTVEMQEQERLAAEAAALEAIRKKEEEDAQILEEMRILEELHGQQRRDAVLLFRKRAILEQMLKQLHLDAQQRANQADVAMPAYEEIATKDRKERRLGRNAARIAQRKAKN